MVPVRSVSAEAHACENRFLTADALMKVYFRYGDSIFKNSSKELCAAQPNE
ncbi:hypothetical protein THTE_1218 [Thermogutta terrifontis]|uniref:Uncharacterized protein n=1 Tax=Thermogutta terrifontis TaxID=1331910 RepID=A0A286RCY9_9BACT|nr:hypothetical protein THTE_1218 [Thermogutta terrifontis]